LVKEAKIEITDFESDKTTVSLGDSFTLTLDVRNSGNLNAEGVSATLTLLDGLSTDSLTKSVTEEGQEEGIISAGAGASISWTVNADKEGEYDIKVDVTSTNDGSDSATTSITVATTEEDETEETPPGLTRKNKTKSFIPPGLSKKAEMTPDSFMYGFKKLFEKIDLFFTFDETKKLEKHLKYAKKRLAEAEAVVDKEKPEFLGELFEEYEKEINKASEILDFVEEKNKKELLSEIVSKATTQHLEILDEVKDKVPEKERERIIAAKERSIRGNQEALKALARENPEKAAEIALGIAEEKIKKVEEVEEGDKEEISGIVEEYRDYMKFGDEISSIAKQVGKDYSKVQELVDKATSSHIIVLEDVLKKVPEQAKPAIQDAIRRASEGKDTTNKTLEEVDEEEDGKSKEDILVTTPIFGDESSKSKETSKKIGSSKKEESGPADSSSKSAMSRSSSEKSDKRSSVVTRTVVELEKTEKPNFFSGVINKFFGF
jgi:uncharacterized repeat protein (TIGR01451 family)